MKKLYEKSEICFAVASIIIYVMLMGNLRNNFGDGSIFTLLGLIVIALILTIFIVKNNLCEKYGFTKITDSKKYLFFIPLVLLISVNFWPGAKLHFSPVEQIFAVLSMALVGFVEEVIFRGLLFKAIEKDNVKEAIIISAVTFGAGHIVNLFTGQLAVYTILQVFYAIAIGFAFVMLFYKSKSIVPCILAHSLIDITSTFSGESTLTLDYIASVFIIVVAVAYAVYLGKRVKN